MDTDQLKLETKIEDQLDGSLKNATSFTIIENTGTEQNDAGNPTFNEFEPVLDEIPTNLESPEIVEPITEAPVVNKTVELKPDSNLTEEEIPVFSEWAQKQMAAVEEKQKKDEENASITMAAKPSNQKVPVVKLRAKNYASPDCGAKILAANSDAQSTGSVLTTSKDEYLLSPCASRIWFVVELCEAIQAEKVDLANFELFSSSPKEFSVSVSNRFPTRDWSTVGQFTANDERNIQTFNLNPQLYGKFVRVDIHSHYNSEHYCPVSLFRVFGTSEMEALETENQPLKLVEEFDDEDDPISIEENNVDRIRQQGDEKNLLKTAGEAVINIVKKAAEVLSKTNGNSNATEKNQSATLLNQHNCISLLDEVQCNTCSSSLNASVDYLLKCKQVQLLPLLKINVIARNLLESKLCANYVNLGPHLGSDITKWNYVTVILPLNVSVALCNLIRFESAPNQVEHPTYESPFVTTQAASIGENYVTPHPNDYFASFNKGLDAFSEEEQKENAPSDTLETNQEPAESVPSYVITDQPVEPEPSIPLIDPTPPTPLESPENINIPAPTPIESPPPSEDNKGDESPEEQTTEIPEILATTVVPTEVELTTQQKDWEHDIDSNGELNPTTPPVTQKGQPESVFLRLSNRIKVIILIYF